MPGKTDTRAKADNRFFTGSTGSGKSHQIKQGVKKARRVLVFDPDDEYADDANCQRVSSIRELAASIPRDLTKPVRLTLPKMGMGAFEKFCRIAWEAQDARAPLTVAIDELAGVDRVAKADGWWHSLISRGRKYRTTILAGAQSGTEISKTLMRQRSQLWIGYLEETPDHRYLAERTGIPTETIAQLRPEPHFDAIVLERGKEPYMLLDKGKSRRKIARK